jgi:hypothetical protein
MGLNQLQQRNHIVFKRSVLSFKAQHQSNHPPAALQLPGQSVSA